MSNDSLNGTRRDFILGAGSVALLSANRGAFATPPEAQMATFTTRDDVTIYYKDWGPRDGNVVILSHGWPLNADSWKARRSTSPPTAVESSRTTAAATAVRRSRGTAMTWITMRMTSRS